ncbi:PMS1 protein homolog 1 isoform X2 [Amia ocellicauda]|uniref:PMS1 protein homolog 1 isoform X2 n=1 Tax=Amia ocellicauda TaxID=2972642 RepID=UPI003463E815
MKHLPPETVRLLSSSQDNYGFDRIEVRDNGSGIKASDTPVMAVSHYTSKITSHDDLESLETYGFRGEALGSICAVSEVIITTKTAEDHISNQYTLDFKGNVISQKPSHLGQGTTVCVLKLFKNLPVRKQFYSTTKKCKEELKKVQDLLMAYGIIKPQLRITFTHNKAIVWQKAKVSDHKMALMSVLGTGLIGNMLLLHHHQEQPEIKISGYVPKPGSDYTSTSTSNPDKTFIFVNQRPVHQKEILKLVKHLYSSQSSTESSHGRYPVMMMHITVPASSIDVNLTPDKSQIMFQNKDAVLSAVEAMFTPIYGSQSSAEHKDIAGTDHQPSPGETGLPASCESPDRNCISAINKGKQTAPGQEGESLTGCKRQVLHDKGPRQTSDIFTKAVHESIPDSTSSSSEDSQIFKNAREFGLTSSLTDETITDDNLEENRLLGTGKGGIGSTSENSQDANVGRIKATSEITVESWSRGHALKDPSTGEWLKPVKIHIPNEETSGIRTDTNQESPETCKSSCKKMSNAVTEKMAKLTAYDLISNRTVRQPMSASAIFEQEMQPQILQEHAKANLQDITSIAEEMWKNLGEEEKKNYEDKAEKDLLRYNSQTKKATEQGTSGKEAEKRSKLASPQMRPSVLKRKAPLSNQQILNKLFQSQSEKKHSPEKPSKTVPFSVTSLKQRIKLLTDEHQQKPEGPQLVNRLASHSAWVVLSGKNLMLLNPSRVEEALLFKRLLENNILPAVNLQTPIQLTDGLLGGVEYTGALCSMEKERPELNGMTYFSDPRLVANGFKVRLIPGALSTERSLEVAGMADCVPFFGVADLKEIVTAVLKRNAKTVQECRPLKVVSYLEGEAVRLARQLPLHFSREDINDTLSRMKQQLGKERQTCIHGRPFFHYLKALPETEQQDVQNVLNPD